MVDKNVIFEVSKNVLRVTSPLTWLVIDSTEKAIEKSSTVSINGDIEEMKREASRQEISLKISEAGLYHCQCKTRLPHSLPYSKAQILIQRKYYSSALVSTL